MLPVLWAAQLATLTSLKSPVVVRMMFALLYLSVGQRAHLEDCIDGEFALLAVQFNGRSEQLLRRIEHTDGGESAMTKYETIMTAFLLVSNFQLESLKNYP